MLAIAARLAIRRPAPQRQLLAAACALFVLAVLFRCIPQDRVVGAIEDGEITACVTARAAVDETIAKTEPLIVSGQIKFIEGWPARQARLRGEADHAPFVVLKLAITRWRQIVEGTRPWNRGHVSAEGWTDVAGPRDALADYSSADCARYPLHARVLFHTVAETKIAGASTMLTHFLGGHSVEPATTALLDELRAR